MNLTDKNGKPITIGTTLVNQDYPHLRITVVNIHDHGAGLAIETDWPIESPHRLNQRSLNESRWIVA